ncbi:hypothetical protein [Mesobacillus zeae]|uniref:Uncharacterized protein n=1 Tax=Mesobacillus zeae TaxID=1917180 RepID=A0A398B786_9BACI|nr:hypothetical protein [Mesobacillus zeae]RID85702.1 hypothetical protein D1970_09135 [Mesobacillus zeae]
MIYLVIGGAILLAVIMYSKSNNIEAKANRFQREFREYYKETWDVFPTSILTENYINRLDTSLDRTLMERVNTSFRLKHPRMTQYEANLYWRELKRYFMLAGMFKSVEMFNEKIDDLWHALLHYEKEYEDFSNRFIGHKLKHIPHSQPSFKPEERTFFDFCYVQMFTLDTSARKIWGEFFKHDKGSSFLQEYTNLPMQDLKEKYMRSDSSQEAEASFESYVHWSKQEHKHLTPMCVNKYNQTNDASYSYVAYAASDDSDHETTFNEIFKGSHHSPHYGESGYGGDSDGGISNCSSGSSCSSCSSCSSS